MTATERVGLCLALAILLKFPEIATLFETAHKKQREKYLTFPSKTRKGEEEEERTKKKKSKKTKKEKL
eukprot:5234539-Ditylum_brightwellii.AAC.1